jgi:hypothetical protein
MPRNIELVGKKKAARCQKIASQGHLLYPTGRAEQHPNNT